MVSTELEGAQLQLGIGSGRPSQLSALTPVPGGTLHGPLAGVDLAMGCRPDSACRTSAFCPFRVPQAPSELRVGTGEESAVRPICDFRFLFLAPGELAGIQSKAFCMLGRIGSSERLPDCLLCLAPGGL